MGRNEHLMEVRQHWDFFMVYAVEDQEAIARPLADALNARGVLVWYVDYSLKGGDNLQKCVDYGLSRSRRGIVILSEHFLGKRWPEQELKDLASREVDRKKAILPVWHKVGFRQVAECSPELAERLAVSTDKGLEYAVERILEATK
ncbi:MAG: toll/interleukin-1 receptor domain-containing protein [Candidatus Acidiferrales bacterium]